MLLTGVARTFAGAPVQNAKVNYHITRSFSWFWRFRGGRSAAWDGETMTDAEGKFTVTVRLEADSDVKDLPTWYYTYRVQADVTDGARVKRNKPTCRCPWVKLPLCSLLRDYPHRW